jgi:hypothetical protein
MVQVQAMQHLLEQLFLPALQPVARPNRRRVGAPLVAGDEGITPEHFAVLLPAGCGQREGERAVLGRVAEAGVLFGDSGAVVQRVLRAADQTFSGKAAAGG